MMTTMLLALMGCSPELTLYVPEDPIAGEVELTAEGNFDRLVIMIDGAVLDGGEGPTLTTTWDSTTVEDGIHQVRGAGFIGNRAPIETVLEIDVSQADGDTIPPQVAITSPSEGQTVGGDEIPISLQITENVGLESVAIYADGDVLANLPPDGPWEVKWESVTIGEHCIEGVAVDLAGNEGSNGICFEVGEESDEVSCTITSPPDGAEIGGETNITVAASASGGIASVDFFANDELIGSDVSAAWSLIWDTTDWLDETVVVSVDVNAAGGGLCTDSVTVDIGEGSTGPDPEGFVVLITDPTDGSTLDVVGTGVPLKAAIGGGKGAEYATLFINDVAQETLTTGWQWNWDATPFVGTDVSLEVVGVELVTGTESSDAITVTVPAGG